MGYLPSPLYCYLVIIFLLTVDSVRVMPLFADSGDNRAEGVGCEIRIDGDLFYFIALGRYVLPYALEPLKNRPDY